MHKAFAGGSIFGVTAGAAPFRVLALPGWMHTVADFDLLFAALGRETGAVALDLPGFGGTTPEPPVSMGAAGYAAAVAPVLIADLTPPTVIVGHSFGGRVAVHLAASHPDRVAGLVLTGVPLLRRQDRPPARPAVSFRLARALHGKGLVSEERMERLRRRSGSSDYRNAASATMRGVLVTVTNETYEDQLRAIRCPVELVWGEGDDQAPLTVAERAARLLGPLATVTVVAGVGHFTPTGAPEALMAAIRKLLW